MEKKFKNETELLDYANEINNSYIKDILTPDQIKQLKFKNKGKLGQAIEKFYFGKKLNSLKAPDFEYLGIELKVAPLKMLKNKKLSPKERVKLTQLDIDDLIRCETITDSNIWPKIKNILIMWYLNNNDFENNKFIKSELLKIEETKFFSEIENDWKILRGMAISGCAHEFSESLTKYLGLARNGSGKNEKMIAQPNGEEKYYKRAYSFKQQMLRSLIQSYNFDYTDSVIDKLKKDLVGKEIKDISKVPINPKYKSAHVKAITNYYGVSNFENLTNKFFEDFGKVYNFKTIPLKKNRDGKYKIKEQTKINLRILNDRGNDWFSSEYSLAFENPFIFIICEYNEDNSKTKILDIKEYIFNEEQVGNVMKAYNEFMFRDINGGLSDGTSNNVNFIKKTDNKFVHFRPWAIRSSDKFTSRFGERLTNPGMWINDNEIEKIIKIDKM